MSYFLKCICAERQGGFFEQKPVYVSQVPIRKAAKNEEDEINKFVDEILRLNARLFSIGSKLTDEKATIERELTEIDAKLDSLVYDLYELTEVERKIVEGS